VKEESIPLLRDVVETPEYRSHPPDPVLQNLQTVSSTDIEPDTEITVTKDLPAEWLDQKTATAVAVPPVETAAPASVAKPITTVPKVTMHLPAAAVAVAQPQTPATVSVPSPAVHSVETNPAAVLPANRSLGARKLSGWALGALFLATGVAGGVVVTRTGVFKSHSPWQLKNSSTPSVQQMMSGEQETMASEEPEMVAAANNPEVPADSAGASGPVAPGGVGTRPTLNGRAAPIVAATPPTSMPESASVAAPAP
jgi:hypothetical protein